MDRPDVAIVIPAFNEAATIVAVVKSVASFGQPIVVDDCSADDTACLAISAGATVVGHRRNLGYDGALNSGFEEADRLGYLYAITLDADGQHSPLLLEAFISRLKEGYDLVLGVRPRPARFGEWLFAKYAKATFGFQDPLCGMKGYKMSLYREQGWFDSYQSIGTELALYGLRAKKKWTQLPIPIAPRVGAPRFAARWKANCKILRAMVRASPLGVRFARPAPRETF